MLLLLRALVFLPQLPSELRKTLFICGAQLIFASRVKVVPEPLLVLAVRPGGDRLFEEDFLESGVIRRNGAIKPANHLTPVTYRVTIRLHDSEIQTQRSKTAI
jgi:hypothetical protein